jgi:prepilin-type N-terminal cleavage/methylation domain-containing protein
MNSKRGFTLIEVLITIVILGIVLSVLYNILFFQINTFNKADKKTIAQSDLRYISDFITNEIRYAKTIDILNSSSDMDSLEHKYIYAENGNVYYRDNSKNIIKKLNIESRESNYDIKIWTENNESKVVYYQISSVSQNFDLGSSINLLNTKLSKKEGVVIKYQQPNFKSLLSFIDESNRFWYDLVKASLENTLNVVDGYQSSQEVDGGALSLNVKSTTKSSGGSSLFVNLDKETFSGTNADINSYSITVDARVNGGKGGYGILINGVLNPQNQDSGYMFQFDPGAYGFVIREITDASHSTTANIGAKMTSGNKYNLNYNAIYSPKHLENEKFKWTKDTQNSDSDWFKRYKTEIKAQTQSDGSLIIRAVIIDENGNRSNEMWFGDFGEITLNGSTFEGVTLGKYKNTRGNIFGLRVWDNDGGKAKTDFYNIAIGSAEPAPKKVEVDTTSNQLKIKFDDSIVNEKIDINNIKIKSNGVDYEIKEIKNNGFDIDITLKQKKIKGKNVPIPSLDSDYVIEYNKPSSGDGLKDSFGNTVTDFVFDKGFYIKQ